MNTSTPILILRIISTHFCFSQTSFKLGAELGISASKFPDKKTYTVRTDEVTRSYNPIFSPIIGLNGELFIKKHLQLTFGLQYQMTGTRYTNYRDGRIPRDYDLPIDFTYTSEIIEEQKFHKICLPITIGYSFNIGKIKPSLFVGIRPNLFLTGRYYFKSDFDASENSRDSRVEFELNPLSSEQVGQPMNRFHNQILIGLSTSFGEKYRINLTYSNGYQMYYSEYEQNGWESNNTIFENADFGFSLTYFFLNKTSENK